MESPVRLVGAVAGLLDSGLIKAGTIQDVPVHNSRRRPTEETNFPLSIDRHAVSSRTQITRSGHLCGLDVAIKSKLEERKMRCSKCVSFAIPALSGKPKTPSSATVGGGIQRGSSTSILARTGLYAPASFAALISSSSGSGSAVPSGRGHMSMRLQIGLSAQVDVG
ncbi:hypothetical protein Asppvi_001783 [Aspergillus pseudoviridinutans]|uniref:Uncharacterized protein n=1 Tax=Aspergillus pseudoviridinutans TaxID=1517512 RepID=A0A9P3BND8_9EURO|nr:uncharacterized protein Asppvi_001783 [Aspergillus pseudoviridinutans]GIJ92505.1 hypothetical protein Asppvi_001783 [Aspergillus pseudoviridinutans]